MTRILTPLSLALCVLVTPACGGGDADTAGGKADADFTRRLEEHADATCKCTNEAKTMDDAEACATPLVDGWKSDRKIPGDAKSTADYIETLDEEERGKLTALVEKTETCRKGAGIKDLEI